MKYRVQLNAVFSNADANSILDQVESIKTKPFSATGYTAVPIVREAKKLQYVSDGITVATEHDSVDFESGVVSHTGDQGETEYEVAVDVSFDVQQDYYDFINYIETIKGSALTTSNQIRSCRSFICRHDEVPLQRDGGYSNINFDGQELTYPITFE